MFSKVANDIVAYCVQAMLNLWNALAGQIWQNKWKAEFKPYLLLIYLVSTSYTFQLY